MRKKSDDWKEGGLLNKTSNSKKPDEKLKQPKYPNKSTKHLINKHKNLTIGESG